MNDDNALLRRERGLLVLLGLICIALLGGAWGIQKYLNYVPCPLCIIQRYGLALGAIFSLAGAALGGRWRSVRVAETLAALAALIGLAAAAWLVWVQAHPAASCGRDALDPIVNALPPARWWPALFESLGLCTEPYPPILGLSLPMWGLIAFACMFVPLALSLWANRRRRKSSWPGGRF